MWRWAQLLSGTKHDTDSPHAKRISLMTRSSFGFFFKASCMNLKFRVSNTSVFKNVHFLAVGWDPFKCCSLGRWYSVAGQLIMLRSKDQKIKKSSPSQLLYLWKSQRSPNEICFMGYGSTTKQTPPYADLPSDGDCCHQHWSNETWFHWSRTLSAGR